MSVRGGWTAADPALVNITIYQDKGGRDSKTIENVKRRTAFFDSLPGLVRFTARAVKYHIRVARVKFVYVTPRLWPADIGCGNDVSGTTPVVLDPHCDPAIQQTLATAATSSTQAAISTLETRSRKGPTALERLKARNVEVTCEVWFAPVVAAHLTQVVFDFLPDTEWLVSFSDHSPPTAPAPDQVATTPTA